MSPAESSPSPGARSHPHWSGTILGSGLAFRPPSSNMSGSPEAGTILRLGLISQSGSLVPAPAATGHASCLRLRPTPGGLGARLGSGLLPSAAGRPGEQSTEARMHLRLQRPVFH